MEDLFLSVLNMSLTASYVIAVITLARFFLKKAPKTISYALWSTAGFRLVFPISFESVFSLIPFKSDPVPPDIAVQAIPRIDSGITIVDDTVSRVLPAAMPAVSVNPMQTIVAAGIAVWLIGIATMLIYSVVSIALLKRQLRGAAPSARNIYEVGNLKTPFVLGFIHPKIYIPSGLSPEEKSYIIRHEQTHIKRFDHIVKLTAFLILCLHWFNPLVWLAFVLMSADMEMSCDERVIKDMGGEIKKAYSASLLSLATGRSIINSSPLAFGEGNIRGRIKNVLNFKKPATWVITASILLVAALCIGLSANKADYSDSDITNFPSYEYDRVTFTADASPYPQAFETITATLTNAKMEPGLMCGEAFGIVRYDGEVWRDVPFAEDLGFNDLGVDLPVGASKTYSITPDMFNGKVEPGNYRIVTAVWYADEQPPQTKHNVWADFTINAPHVEIYAWKENSTVKYSVFTEATAARTERAIYENSVVFSDIAEVNRFLSGYQTGYMTISLRQMNITDFTKQEMQAISESLRIPAGNYSLGIGVYVPESPPVAVPSADNSSKVTPSPTGNKIENTNNQSSPNDVDSASKAYQRLLAGDFSEARAKTGVTNTGEDYARQYAPFYSVNPDENKWEYTLVDMDDDGIPELFIRLETSPDITAIFHWANDGIVCWEFDTVEATSFYTPLENGMIWSKYKNSNNIYKVDNSGTFKLVLEFTQENTNECEAYITEHLSTRVIQPDNWYSVTNIAPVLNIA